jgi:hypothetical protein
MSSVSFYSFICFYGENLTQRFCLILGNTNSENLSGNPLWEACSGFQKIVFDPKIVPKAGYDMFNNVHIVAFFPASHEGWTLEKIRRPLKRTGKRNRT